MHRHVPSWMEILQYNKICVTEYRLEENNDIRFNKVTKRLSRPLKIMTHTALLIGNDINNINKGTSWNDLLMSIKKIPCSILREWSETIPYALRRDISKCNKTKARG